jgi:ParB family chromosome partitioning protein
MAFKKRGLGRGLEALLVASGGGETEAGEQEESENKLREIPVDLIQSGKYQPRRDMDAEALQELADSIKVQGVIQPIVIRPIGEGKFEIIAGERRWRATQLAGLDAIPALIRDVPDEAAIAMSLIENIQRENLNPIEEAMALQRLQQEFELTQQEVADAVGKSRTTVTNLLRLMGLQVDVRTLLEHGDLEMGHARALLGLSVDDQSAAARTVVGKGMSVRQAEALVRKLLSDKDKPAAEPKHLDPNIRHLQDKLAQTLGAKVQIQLTGRAGRDIAAHQLRDTASGGFASPPYQMQW